MHENNSKPIVSILFHNYYGRESEVLASILREIDVPFSLFYNGVMGSYYRQRNPFKWEGSLMHTQFLLASHAVIRESPNIGKDIGGKLVLMDAYLRGGLYSDYMLLIHDKNSPYHTNSRQWREELFRLTTRECIEQMLDVFANNANVGIVASKNAIRNESNNNQRSNFYTDSGLISDLKEKYTIQPPDLRYVAGTVFFVRSKLFEEFFRLYLPLEIRSTLEAGNVTDNAKPTVTHSWERLLSWLVTSQGYQIKGI